MAGLGVETGDVNLRPHVAVTHGDVNVGSRDQRRPFERPAVVVGFDLPDQPPFGRQIETDQSARIGRVRLGRLGRDLRADAGVEPAFVGGHREAGHAETPRGAVERAVGWPLAIDFAGRFLRIAGPGRFAGVQVEGKDLPAGRNEDHVADDQRMVAEQSVAPFARRDSEPNRWTFVASAASGSPSEIAGHNGAPTSIASLAILLRAALPANVGQSSLVRSAGPAFGFGQQPRQPLGVGLVLAGQVAFGSRDADARTLPARFWPGRASPRRSKPTPTAPGRRPD